MIRRRMGFGAALLFSPGCLWLTGGLFGCRSDAPTEERMQVIRQLADIAKEHGLTGYVDVDVDGSPSVGMTQDFYLDTGVRARARLQFNSAGGKPAEGE